MTGDTHDDDRLDDDRPDDRPEGRAPDELTPDEARLLAALGDALPADRLPAGLVDRAEGLVTFMDVDLELVALLESGSGQTADEAEPAGVRGASAGTRVVLEHPDGTFVVELGASGTDGTDGTDGQVVGAAIASVGLERLGDDGRPHLVTTADVDELGHFSLRAHPTGPVRLLLRNGSGRTWRTGWFLA